MFGKGELSRDFLYVEDAAEALVKLIDVDYPEPLTIATGIEVSKRNLVRAIVEATNYQGKVTWDGKKDRGQLKRSYDVHEMKRVLKWSPQTDINTGIKKTVEWYKESIR